MNQNRTLAVVAAALVLIGGAAVAAIALTSGDDDSDAGGGSGEPASTVVVVGETLPVSVAGDPLPMLGAEGPDPAIGQAMPVIVGQRFDGSTITVGGPTDGPTMYVFLAHWCPHCNDEIPELIELERAGEIPAGLNVVGISTAVAADRDNYPPSEWVADKGWPWDVMADDELATSFVSSGGSGFPYTVLADADGTVLAREAGSRPSEQIKLWLDANLAAA